MNAMEESAEVFDDLYLGLRAGGALRKQRRGEALTPEEEEALSRWQRLSTWRKALAIGGFGFGTFALGFTLGGHVFGRWRKASRNRQLSLSFAVKSIAGFSSSAGSFPITATSMIVTISTASGTATTTAKAPKRTPAEVAEMITTSGERPVTPPRMRGEIR